MALRSDWSEALCPIGRSLDVLGDPWVLLIVRDVLHGRGRFDELHAGLGISEAVLSRRLQAMREAGLLTKVDYSDGPRTRQAYAATEAAADLLPILQQLALWAEKHTATPAGGGHMALIHESCGAETTQAAVCSACGEPLVPDQMSWDKPWKGTRERLQGAAQSTSAAL
ncbi:winged helix-turn-helix transcriptional regulator [Brevibacterium atlanticum]|uniref:winged helix-turn-helix transcriptional regulator n=1 Tax=Brevibacterium atlanticum TaxID=2697563 RepID=UPI00142219EE|nr:helix-turn-helix domain-containing protein [Brevibacterium atlanticum]